MIKTIPKFWDDFYKSLTYEESLFRDPDQLSVWENAGHYLPNTSILINQNFTVESFPEIKKNFNELREIGICFHKILPGHYLPTHIDRYSFYKNKYNVTDSNKIHRYVMFLEDWSDGHLITIDNQVYTNWKAGDCVGWSGKLHIVRLILE